MEKSNLKTAKRINLKTAKRVNIETAKRVNLETAKKVNMEISKIEGKRTPCRGDEMEKNTKGSFKGIIA